MSRVLPILFNTDMVRAILDGRKTVTRRICKDGDVYSVPDMGFYDSSRRTYGVHNYTDLEHEYTNKVCTVERPCPICPGDILYVRETWSKNKGKYRYREVWERDGIADIAKWKPSIHMPKEAARIWLKVTDVRIERLQDIDEGEARKEGFVNDICLRNGTGKSAARHFVELWNSTIKKSDFGKYGWSANPWVWVIEFGRCGKPESEG